MSLSESDPLVVSDPLLLLLVPLLVVSEPDEELLGKGGKRIGCSQARAATGTPAPHVSEPLLVPLSLLLEVSESLDDDVSLLSSTSSSVSFFLRCGKCVLETGDGNSRDRAPPHFSLGRNSSGTSSAERKRPRCLGPALSICVRVGRET